MILPAPKDGFIHSTREAVAGRGWQLAAFSFCVLLGLAMIVNNQLAGEATWFWYATFFHRGLRLYADLHLALQPLFVLEMDVWMKLFGRSLLVMEIPSVLHLLVLCLGLVLLLRESDWPDWQKAVVLVGTFALWVTVLSYRFDDYHVTTESFIVYSLILLLLLARANALRRQLVLVLALGVLCGLTIASRLNDGAALLASACLCLLVLARTRKVLLSVVFVATAVLTWILIVKLTGDTVSDYISNSFTKAVGSKGGTNSLLADPFLLFRNALIVLVTLPLVALVVAAGAFVQRYWTKSLAPTIAVQLVFTAGIYLPLTTHLRQSQLRSGMLVQLLILLLIVASYPLALVVVARWSIPGTRRGEWDAREILLLVPFAELISVSVSGGGNPLWLYYGELGMLLLLLPVIRPFRKQVGWANASFLTMLVLLAIAGTVDKVSIPYAWDNQPERPMFVGRQWYMHPVYGPMYIDRDQLRFGESICSEISQGNSKPELLSLPLSYPNYFCDVLPWHGYVQTFFDISARSTIEKMTGELKTAPPQWIVYQRQMHSLALLEQTYNHGQPLAQRDLDDLIMQRIASGQWQLVEKKDYQIGDGWYVIRTRP